MNDLLDYALPMFDVISFDIFDTFLLRPVLKPDDMFLLVGGEAFAAARKRAESVAARETGGHYTLDDIYARIPAQFRKMRQAEVCAERDRTVVNPAMLAVYNRARELRKRIVFVSDMYLPDTVLRDILAAKGITEYDGLYVSCMYKCGKADGRLLQCMLDDQGVAPDRVMHIGDNRYTDVAGANSLQMYAWYTSKIQNLFFDREQRLAGFFERCGGMNNRHMRLFYGALVLAWYLNTCRYGDDPWRRTGCTFTAPIYYSYMMWVLEQAKRLGKKKLALVLRDCHSIGEMLSRIAPDVQYKYIAASRAILRPLLDNGLASEDGKRVAHYLRSKIIDTENTLVVEGTSGHLTCERAIQLVFERSLPTTYLNLTGRHGDAHAMSFIKNPNYLTRYLLLENIGHAPFNSYTGISADGEPVVKEESRYEAYRSYGVKRREETAVATAVLLHANGEYLTGEECEKFVDYCLYHSDKRDVLHFINQYGAPDPDHNVYQGVYWCR